MRELFGDREAFTRISYELAADALAGRSSRDRQRSNLRAGGGEDIGELRLFDRPFFRVGNHAGSVERPLGSQRFNASDVQGGSSGNTPAAGPNRGVAAAGDAKLGEDVGDVVHDRAGTDG